MARSYARINVGIWDNDDFVSLAPDAKLLFFHIISRRDLSPLGSLVIRATVWARQVFNGDETAIWVALAELEMGRYIFVDAETGELLLRTFLRHDNNPHVNWKHSSAIRGAVDRLDSEKLREIAVGLTEGLPVNTRDQPPDIAQSNGQSNGQPILLDPSSFILHPSSLNLDPSSFNRASPPTVLTAEQVGWAISVQRTKTRPRVKNVVEYARGVYKTMRTDGELDELTEWLMYNRHYTTPEQAAHAYETEPINNDSRF